MGKNRKQRNLVHLQKDLMKQKKLGGRWTENMDGVLITADS